MRIFGWLAGSMSALHNVPQIIHICKRKSASDISTSALAMRMLSLGLYIAHGILIEDMPILVTSSIILFQTVVICFQKYSYTRTIRLTDTVSSQSHVSLELASHSDDRSPARHRTVQIEKIST